MAAKVTVRELVTKLTIGGNATDRLAKFGLAMNGVKAGLGILVGVVKAASRATLGLVDDVTSLGDSIAKTSRQIGISARSFQRLSFAADRSGASARSLRKGLLNISKNLRDAEIAAGKGKGTGFTGALAELGLRFKDLQGLSPEKQLGLLGDALNGITDKSRRAALAQQLLGVRSGPELASLLAEGTGGLKALGDEAERLGLVLDDKALAASEAFQDSMTDLKAVLTGVKNTIGVALIPIVEKAVKNFKDWILANKDFIKINFEKVVKALTGAFDELIKNSDKIVSGFEDLVNLGRGVFDFFSGLIELVGGLSNAIKIAAAGWVAYKAAMIAATAGLLLNPFVALGVALAGIAAALVLIEIESENARKALLNFQSVSSKADKPVDEKQARSDASAIARGIRSGQGVDRSVRKRLAGTSRAQLNRTFGRAEALIARGTERVAGPFGSTVVRRVSRGNLPGEVDALRALEARTRADRDAAREAIARESEIDAMFAENIGDISTPVPVGATGGGRRFRPISEGLGKGKKGTDESLNDILIEAIKSGQLPESAALLTSTQPPIIIPITNITVQMEVDASTEINGIAGEDVESFGERVRDVVVEALGTEMRDAMDQLRPQLAR
jgi:hypothetical protein